MHARFRTPSTRTGVLPRPPPRALAAPKSGPEAASIPSVMLGAQASAARRPTPVAAPAAVTSTTGTTSASRATAHPAIVHLEGRGPRRRGGRGRGERGGGLGKESRDSRTPRAPCDWLHGGIGRGVRPRPLHRGGYHARNRIRNRRGRGKEMIGPHGKLRGCIGQ